MAGARGQEDLRLEPTSKLTDERLDSICNLIEAGNHIKVAAQASGITKQTLYNWLNRGKEAEMIEEQAGEDKVPEHLIPYLNASRRIRLAVANAETRNVAIIANAATDQWQAAAWMLERKNPERWGRKELIKIELEKEINSVLDKLKDVLPPEYYERALECLAGDASGDAGLALGSSSEDEAGGTESP